MPSWQKTIREFVVNPNKKNFVQICDLVSLWQKTIREFVVNPNKKKLRANLCLRDFVAKNNS